MNKEKKWADDPKLKMVALCCQALDDKKAEEIRILQVSELSSITDYLIIATGNSEPHLRALTQEVSRVLKDAKHYIVGHEMNPQTGWTVLDAHDAIIHLFLPEKRGLYQLDSLWKDGRELDVSDFVEAPTEPTGQQRGR
jgi:ribosome-associated protein